MRLAISNIAWNVDEDERVAALLRQYSVDAIDIAPGKYFPAPADSPAGQILELKQQWADRGAEITGMQALLFGTTGLNMFGDTASQAAMLAHFSAICRIGGLLGATRLVFGSPKNRDRGELTDTEALDRAVIFFDRLGNIAADAGVMICLEPNPPCYGANFMTTTPETARVVGAVGHPAIRMQLDTGAMTINRENPHEIVTAYAGLVGHIHASEPGLVPLGEGGTDHGQVRAALSDSLADRVVSIEMVATQAEPHTVSIERALRTADRYYRVPAGDDSE